MEEVQVVEGLKLCTDKRDMMTEIFISNLLKEPFDYTKWQSEHFGSISLEEFSRQAVQYDKEHPFK